MASRRRRVCSRVRASVGSRENTPCDRLLAETDQSPAEMQRFWSSANSRAEDQGPHEPVLKGRSSQGGNAWCRRRRSTIRTVDCADDRPRDQRAFHAAETGARGVWREETSTFGTTKRPAPPVAPGEPPARREIFSTAPFIQIEKPPRAASGLPSRLSVNRRRRRRHRAVRIRAVTSIPPQGNLPARPNPRDADSKVCVACAKLIHRARGQVDAKTAEALTTGIPAGVVPCPADQRRAPSLAQRSHMQHSCGQRSRRLLRAAPDPERSPRRSDRTAACRRLNQKRILALRC